MSRLLVLAALVLLAAAPVARAHGDPAGDYLLGHPTFVPAADAVPQASEAQLDATVAAANAGGYPIRVAVIGTRDDLGAAAALWLEPRRYALFLGKELGEGRLLVVMPNGLAVSKGGDLRPAEQRKIAGIAAPGRKGAALAAAATAAVSRLAGVPPAKPGHVAASSTSRDRLTIVGIVVVTLLAAAAFTTLRRGYTGPTRKRPDARGGAR